MAATDDVGQTKKAKKRACEVLKSLIVWLMGADEKQKARRESGTLSLSVGPKQFFKFPKVLG